jgi:hypothetical protein
MERISNMKERPILFSGPMVRAILEGRKTQTRRVVTLTDSGRVKAVGSSRNWHLDDANAVLACPYGQPGDRLWVRESGWQPPYLSPKMLREGADTWPRYVYNADGDEKEWCRENGWKSRPSIHMPRWASRITLEVAGVRVERLNAITHVDAIAEGCEPHPDAPHQSMGDDFKRLWQSINGPGSWDLNPWVWVVEFKKLAPNP